MKKTAPRATISTQSRTQLTTPEVPMSTKKDKTMMASRTSCPGGLAGIVPNPEIGAGRSSPWQLRQYWFPGGLDMRHCGHKTVANCPLQNNDGGYVNKGIGEVLGPPNTVFWRPAWCGRSEERRVGKECSSGCWA